MYIKVVNERIQTEVVPGDIVQAGILISNSEVGMGSVSVKPLIYRLVCTNGMVADVGVGKRHVAASMKAWMAISGFSGMRPSKPMTGRS